MFFMKYKAIALDLDGTLLNSKKEVSSKNKEIIKKAAKAGVKIILASGAEVNDLFGTYIKKTSKKELKKLQKRIIKKFAKKFEEVFCDVNTFDL